MNLNLKEYVYLKHDVLDNEFCQFTINELENSNNWKKHHWSQYKHQEKITSTNDNDPENIYSYSPEQNDINDFLKVKIKETLIEYISHFDFQWFTSILNFTDVKFIKYSLNHTMKPHCDHIRDIFDGQRKGIPILTIIGLLNNDFEGGNLVLFKDTKINIKEGDIVIFPSLFLFPHEITPITKGIRYSYISWAW